MLKKLKLISKRLILRDFHLTDLNSYITLRDDIKFKRFYNDSDVTQDKSKYLLEMFVSQSVQYPRINYQLAITTKNDVLVGSCGIRIENNNIASVGCELGRLYQTTGYAYEASKKVIDFAFSELNVQHIYAETISENWPAIRLCKKLGLKLETELIDNKFFHGRWWNLSRLGLSKKDYTI